MIVTTKNSVYSLAGKGDHMSITKVAAINKDSSYYKPGQTIFTRSITVIIGQPMCFHDGITMISTSPVVHVEG